jgi:hypothetical protein
VHDTGASSYEVCDVRAGADGGDAAGAYRYGFGLAARAQAPAIAARIAAIEMIVRANESIADL